MSMPVESPELLVIVGMPGSGKTTYANKLIAKGYLAGFSDDYQYGLTRSSAPTLTEADYEIMDALAIGQSWAVADTRYCDEGERLKISEAFQGMFARIVINFVYFENNPERCANNAIVRHRGDLLKELNLIYYYSDRYMIPPDAKIKKVHRA